MTAARLKEIANASTATFVSALVAVDDNDEKFCEAALWVRGIEFLIFPDGSEARVRTHGMNGVGLLPTYLSGGGARQLIEAAGRGATFAQDRLCEIAQEVMAELYPA